MHGIEPTEPCPNCGEIPRFSDAAMSLNFSSDEPVKAVDGRTKCAWPDCVSDSARLYCEYLQQPWRDCQLPEIEPAQTQGKQVAGELDGLTDE